MPRAARPRKGAVMASKPETTPSEPLSMFERVKLKNKLVGRVMRALKDAPDDDLRLQIINEVAALAALVPKQPV